MFGPVVAAHPSARFLTASLGNVPGSLLDQMCWLVSPVTFGWSRWVDLMNSLSDPEALRTYLLVERWTLDELALPQRLFEEVCEWLTARIVLCRGRCC
jgi:polyhydroxyalkanoate synthase